MRKRQTIEVVLILFLFLILVGVSSGVNKIFENKKAFVGFDKKSELSDTFYGKKEYYIKLNEGQNISDLVKKIELGKIKYVSSDKVYLDLNYEEMKEMKKKFEIVKEAPVYYVDLLVSVPLVNSSVTWSVQQNGINLTGAGQSVCIIDTGVNYSHLDLGGCYGDNNVSSGCKVVGGYDFVNGDSNPYDDNGHGTHVAGIVAANGTYKGVAPGAKIISIKACNSGGSCGSSAIDAGIQWCIGNSSLYNISVISMSLGADCDETPGECNVSYCNSDSLASSINSAVGANISVVVSSGNEGYYNVISSPSCVQNATPVTSSNKADNQISLFANTWNNSALLILTAPGESIVSTSFNGNYETKSGTSMSAPHVSGAIAIINQFLKLSGQYKNPEQIEQALNNTGKQIYDNDYANRSFSRVDVYSIIVSFDNQSPNVNLVAPSNATGVSGLFNQTFRCNATDVELKNVTFYIWNSTSIYNQTFQNVSGSFNLFEINITNIPLNNYTWNCFYSDLGGRSSFATLNNTILIDRIPPVITILSPLNNSWQSIGRFNVSLDESGNCIYSLNSGVFNYTMSLNSSNTGFNSTNSTLLQDARYNVTYYCNDTLGNKNYSSIYFFNVDLTSPNVTLLSPLPSDETSSSSTKIFYYNVSDNLNITKCDLMSNGVIVASNSTLITNSTNNVSYIFSSGSYSYSINCTDEAGNMGNSSVLSFTLTAPVSTSSSGGGGGGGGGGVTTKIVSVSQDKFIYGTSEQVSSGDKIEFSIQSNIQNQESSGGSYSSTKHTITINSLGDNYANFTIRSEPINLILYVEESRKLNLTNSEYYDLFVKLEGIVNKKANITLKNIKEKIYSYNNLSIEENQSLNEIETDNELKLNCDWYFIIIALISLILIVIIWRSYKKKDMTNKVKKNNKKLYK